jgi:hypothetical protein
MNVLKSDAPVSQQYELQTTTQGTLLVELEPDGGGGATTVTPLQNQFWVLQLSTSTGGAAVNTDAPSGAFSTLAAALAAAVPGHTATLFVGEGDYSAEGVQDWGGKGITSLNIIGLPSLQGVTLPAFDCDEISLANVIVLDPGAGAPALLAVAGVELDQCNVLGPIHTGNLAAERCILASGAGQHQIATATLYNCNFSANDFQTLTGFEVDANTLAGMAGNGSTTTPEATPVVFGGQWNYAWLKDANRAINGGGAWDQDRAILPANTLTASRVVTVDLTGAPAVGTSTFIVDVYDDTSVNTLTVNGTVISSTLPQRYVFQVQAGPVLTLISQERAPANQSPS